MTCRVEIQFVRGERWQFIAECSTSRNAWDAVRALSRDYYAAQVIYPDPPGPSPSANGPT